MSDYFSKFTWPLPRGFKSALEFCKFEEGDLLYSDKSAYESGWHPNLGFDMLQIVSPRRSEARSSRSADSIFADNWQSKVVMDLWMPNNNKWRVETTQGALYKSLWLGDLDFCTNPGMRIAQPLGAIQLKSSMKEAVRAIRELHMLDRSCAFLLPFDESQELHLEKVRKLDAAFGATAKSRTHYANDVTDASTEFLPTVWIKEYSIDLEGGAAQKLIQDALYTGKLSGDEAQFKLSNHGWFEEGFTLTA